jgi:hypothetical protein
MPRSRRITSFALILLISFCAMASKFASAQSTVWRNDWMVSAPPALQFFFPYMNSPTGPTPRVIAFAPAGDLLLGYPSPGHLDYQFLRLTSTGEKRWSVNLGGNSGGAEEDTVGGLLPNQDGSAFVTFGDSSGTHNHVAKIDATGAVIWTRQVSARWLAAQSAQRITTAGCLGISALDVDNGEVVWQYPFSWIANSCAGNGLVADGLGNVFATFSVPASGTTTGFHTLKLDINGHIIWDVVSASARPVTPIGVSGAILYVSTDSSVRAIRTGDGSTAWISPGSDNAVLSGNPAEVIATTLGTVKRLSTDTGQPRWSQAVNGTLSVVNGALIVNSSSDLIRLDTESGTINWSTALPATDPSGAGLGYFISGGAADGNLITAGKPTDTLGTTISLQHVDLQNGAILGQIPINFIAQGVEAVSIVADATHIASASVVNGHNGTEIHVRRLDSNDASTSWESIDSASPITPESSLGIVATNASIVITNIPSSLFQPILVEKLDASSGTQQWKAAIYAGSEENFYSSDPVADSDGNIFLAYGATIYCGTSQQPAVCSRQTLVKLSAMDGSVLWRYDNTKPSYGDHAYPQTFVLVGFDVAVVGPFFGTNASSSLIKLSGLDGTVLWSSSIMSDPGISGLSVVSDGNLLVTGNGTAKLDGASGSTLWFSPPPSSAGSCVDCLFQNSIFLANGDLIGFGEENYKPTISLFPGIPNGVGKSWYLGSSAPQLNSYILQPIQDNAGHFWLRLGRRFRGEHKVIGFFAGFDPVTGIFSGQQALGSFDDDPLTTSLMDSFLAFTPENKHLLISTHVVNAPAPTTTGDAVLDMTITATGDLSIQVTTNRTNVMSGDKVGFHLIATYTGDYPVSGVHLRGYLPFTGGVTSANCTMQAASNCIMDTRSGNIQASFDMQPDGRIDISGQIRVLAAPGNVAIKALVYGPIGLSEQDTVNNFASTSLVESIFRSSFE